MDDKRILEIIQENSDLMADLVVPATVLSDICDSLDMASIQWDIEDELGFQLPDDEFAKAATGTVGELLAYLRSRTA